MRSPTLSAQTQSIQFIIDRRDHLKKAVPRESEMEMHIANLQAAIRVLALIERHRFTIESAIGESSILGASGL